MDSPLENFPFFSCKSFFGPSEIAALLKKKGDNEEKIADGSLMYFSSCSPIARKRGVRVYADITRAVRAASVIKLTVKIGGKRGNNGQTPVHISGKRRENSKRANRAFPMNGLHRP